MGKLALRLYAERKELLFHSGSVFILPSWIVTRISRLQDLHHKRNVPSAFSILPKTVGG